MNKRKPAPITCTICGAVNDCSCKFDKSPIDFKARTGVCNNCAALPVKGFDVFTHNRDTVPLIETIKKYGTGNILEIGCNEGYTTALLGSAFADKTIYGIDCAELPDIAFEQKWEIPDATRIGIHAKGLPNVKVLSQDSTNLNYHYFNDIGTIFIDGDHSYSGVKADTEKALGFFSSRGNGLIIWHDSYDGAPKWCGVWKYLNELKTGGLDIQFVPHTWIAYLRVDHDADYINFWNSGSGIGDAIASLYACCGAIKAGHKVKFYTHKTAWLKRASMDGLQVVEPAQDSGYDMNEGYDQQLKTRSDRKQWYCDNMARLASLEPFSPAAPVIDKTISEKRTDLENYVILSPFAAWTCREWPKLKWQKLAQMLMRGGYSVAAIHTDNDRLEEYFAEINGVTWFYGQSPEWIQDVILGAAAVIGNDSGMVHLAGMLGVTTIAIHSHTLPSQLFSYTDIISAQSKNFDCIGCNWQAARGKLPHCDINCEALYDVTPKQVFNLL